MGGASSIGVEDIRPSRDVRSLLIPESNEFIRGSMSKFPCYGVICTCKVIQGKNKNKKKLFLWVKRNGGISNECKL